MSGTSKLSSGSGGGGGGGVGSRGGGGSKAFLTSTTLAINCIIKQENELISRIIFFDFTKN